MFKSYFAVNKCLKKLSYGRFRFTGAFHIKMIFSNYTGTYLPCTTRDRCTSNSVGLVLSNKSRPQTLCLLHLQVRLARLLVQKNQLT